MKSRVGVAAMSVLVSCLFSFPVFAQNNRTAAPPAEAGVAARVPASFAVPNDPQSGDGFAQLAAGLKARSMSSLVRMGLVHPQPVPAGPGVGIAPRNPLTTVNWGAPANASQAFGGFGGPNEPAAAMHPSDPTNALVSGNNFVNVPCTSIDHTSDGGGTFTVIAAPNQCGYGDGVTGWLSANVNSGHTALNVSLNPSGDGADMTLSRSTDSGATWAAVSSTIDVNGFFDDREYLWTDQNPASPFYGRTYVTEALFDSGGTGSYNTVTVRYSTDQGDTWSSSVPLVDPSEFATGTNHNEYPSLAIEPSGTVVAVWHRGACCGVITTDNKVAWSRSTDGGVSWTSSATTPPGTIVDVPLSQTVVFNSTSPGGFRWSDTPNVSADPIDGTLYAVWVQYRTANDTNSAAVYLSKSTDSGDTWSTPIIPYDDPNPELFQYMPWLSVSKAHIVHLTFSSGVGNNNTLAHFYVQSTDGGNTWTAPFQLSSATYAPAGFMGDYQANSVGGDDGSGNESILAAWTDTNSGEENQWARIGTFVAASCTGNYIPSHHSGGSIVPGTTDTGNHCDDCSTGITLPFSYTFYGQAFTSASVTSNGELDFQATTGAPKSGCLPDAGVSYALFPHWDDLRTDGAGEGVFTSVSGVAPHRIFNIEWRAEYKSDGQPVDFEARLYEDTSRFDFVYGSVPQTGSDAAIGAQRDTGSLVSQFACNSNSLSNGEVITFFNSCCPALSTEGAIESTDIHQTGALTQDGIDPSCGTPKSCPGPADSTGRSVDIYPFLNANDITECVTVNLTTACSGSNALFAAAYLGFFDETGICANYLADPGALADGGTVTFSFDVPPSVPFTVVVGEATPGSGCSDYTLDVSIPTPPTAVASGGGTVCQFHATPISGSGGETCSWTPTTGLSDPNSCTPTAQPPVGTTTYFLTVTDSCGASSTNTASVTFNVNPGPDPTITASGPTAFCQGGSVTLTATGGATSYLWSPGGQTSQSILVNATGNYSCTITGANGCVTTSQTVSVTVNSAPVAVASGSATICNGSSTPLTGSGAPNCSWTPVTGLDNPNSCTPNASPALTTTYSLVVTDNIGCQSVNPAQVTITTNPLPVAGNNGPICEGQTLQLTCNIVSGATYHWTGPNGFSSGLRSPSIANATVADAGDYTVTINLSACPPYTSTTTAAVTASPAASPIAVTRCLAPAMTGLTASVPANAGDSYAWTITGGTIDSGQGSDTISFTSGAAGTLMTLQVTDTSTGGCSVTDSETMQVDFTDVPASNPFHDFVCKIARNAITAGCGGGNYCPASSVLRSQMAVFLLRGEHGATYVPPAATGIFSDVPASNPFAPWIERLYSEQITGGCSANPLMYCPSNPVTRAGMAVFLLRAQNGSTYTPPACTGVFTDVACPGPFTDWIEALYAAGITGGCNTNPLMYCPANPVSRAQMAVFLTATFSLP